jgi:hypothetical protein
VHYYIIALDKRENPRMEKEVGFNLSYGYIPVKVSFNLSCGYTTDPFQIPFWLTVEFGKCCSAPPLAIYSHIYERCKVIYKHRKNLASISEPGPVRMNTNSWHNSLSSEN